MFKTGRIVEKADRTSRAIEEDCEFFLECSGRKTTHILILRMGSRPGFGKMRFLAGVVNHHATTV